MASDRIKLSLGLFMATGIILIVTTVIWLGVSKFFETGDFYEIYFDESVQGLDVGSTVKYRGVPVGRVEELTVAPDYKMIKALIKITHEDRNKKRDNTFNVVAQLKSQGITGIMYIELLVYNKEHGSYIRKYNFKTNYAVIPSIPSGMTQIKSEIEEITKDFKEIKFKEVVDEALLVLKNLNVKMESYDSVKLNKMIDKTMVSLDKTLASIDKILVNMNNVVNDNKMIVNSSLKAIEETVGNTNKLVAETRKLMADSSLMINSSKTDMKKLSYNMKKTMSYIEKSAENMSSLMEKLKEQPSVIFQNPPKPRKTTAQGE